MMCAIIKDGLVLQFWKGVIWVQESGGDVAIFDFSGDARPREAQVGDQVELNLVRRGQKKSENMTVLITQRENTSTGCMLWAEVEVEALSYRMEIFIGQNSKLDSVRMSRNRQIRI